MPLSSRRQLVVLTAAKTVANTALRWVAPFLPVLQVAFSTTIGTLTAVMGVAELGGLSTILTGPKLDRGRERTVFIAGLSAVSVSSLIALGGTVTTFAIAFSVLIIGVTNLTVAVHAWIGHRVEFHNRGRAIGFVETSWAIALLVGAPIIAVLIQWFGWRGPFVALAVGSAVAAIVVSRVIEVSPSRPAPSSSSKRLPGAAWPPLITSASTAAAGLGMFVVSGAWLHDRHGVSTGGLGLIAAAFGVVELAASSAVAIAGDRIGTRRSVIIGLLTLLAGLGAVAVSGPSAVVAVASLIVFLAGFEFAFVSTITLMTEAAPEARGRAIGIGNAIGTVARAGAVAASGTLYERFGIEGSTVLAATFAGVALVFTLTSADRLRVGS